MKILFLWHAAVESEYRKLFKELAGTGHELIVVTPTSWTEGGRLQKAAKQEENGYHLIPLPVAFRDRIKGFFYLDLLGLIKTILRFKPDIVHIFEEPCSLSCLQLVTLSRIMLSTKIIVESFENLHVKQQFPFSLIEKLLLKNVDMMINVPVEGRAVWRGKGYTGPVNQVPVGLDENIFIKNSTPFPGCPFLNNRESIRISYVGRLTFEKGVHILIESFSYLIKIYPGCELVIVGRGESSGIKERVRELGIEDKVFYIDPVDSHLLPAFYSCTDILVLPSLTTSNWKEQFGRVLIEAMACEVAVIGSSSGEIPHVLGDAGIVFNEGDRESLLAALKTLATDKELREKMGKAGRERVLGNYTWKSVAEQLVHCYKALINPEDTPDA